MSCPSLNRWALATLTAALLLTTRTSLAQADLAAQSRAAAEFLNQVRANPAAFANLSASLADADVEARPPLVWNVALQRAAERHAKHMADTKEWGHFMTISGQKVGMNQWMREAGYPLVDFLKNSDTNFECIHSEGGFDLNTIGRRAMEGFLAEGKNGGHVLPILGRTDFWKGCKHVGVGMATAADGQTYVSVLVGIYDPFNPNTQPPGQPAPVPAAAVPAPAPANFDAQLRAAVGTWQVNPGSGWTLNVVATPTQWNRIGGVVNLTWFNEQNQAVAAGTGFVNQDGLFAKWGATRSSDMTLFKILPNGTLQGDTTRTEDGQTINYTADAATGGTPGTVEGAYSVGNGLSMSVARNGDAYTVRLTSQAGEVSGIGMRQGDWLAVTWTSNPQSGIVVYTLKGDNTAPGRYATFGQNSLTAENLQRAASQ